MFSILFSFFSTASAMFGGLPVPAVFHGQAPVVHIEASMLCTAIVLDSQTVLTAAHCTSDLEDVNYQIKIINPDTGASTHARITRVIRHPEYKMSFVNHPSIQKTYTDIAIIRFSKKISFPHKAAVLPSSPIDLSTSSTWLVANGSTRSRETSRNQSLPFKMQLNAYHSWYSESLRPKSGPCAGDSGGGYFAITDAEAILVGIQSTRYAAFKCDDARNRGVVVDVQENMYWIAPALVR